MAAGLAPVAGALAVEVLVALLQHPRRQRAPAPHSGGAGQEGVLGAVPHMVRGQLHGFQQTLMQGAAFSQCTACSERAVREYRRRGWHFVLDALKVCGAAH